MNAATANDTTDPTRRLQRALYRAAKAQAARRFHALYDKVYREDILQRAWQEVKAHGGAAGTDGQTIEQIEQRGIEGFLAELGTELREGRYRPRAVRRVWIPKAGGGCGRWGSRRCGIGWSRPPRRWSWSRSSKPTFGPAPMGFGRAGVPTRRWSKSGRA